MIFSYVTENAHDNANVGRVMCYIIIFKLCVLISLQACKKRTYSDTSLSEGNKPW